MAKPGKATKADIEERVNTVFGLLIVGASRQDILQYGTNAWDVKARQIDIYIKRANQKFAEIAAADRKTEFGKAVKRYETLFKSMMKIQDYKGALTAQRELCRLMALNKPAQVNVEHTGKVEHEHISREQRVQEIEAILDRARNRDHTRTLN
jgi:hypothetical protein